MLLVYVLTTAVFLWTVAMAVKSRMYRSNLPLFVALCVLVVGMGAGCVLLVVCETDRYALLSSGLAIGFLLCTVAVLNIRSAFVCDVALEGIYRGFVEYPGLKGQNAFAPVFEYEYEGKQYRVQSAQSYPEKLLVYEMTPGDRYPIYIEAARPENMVLTKRLPLSNVALLVAGVACMVVGVLTLFV